MTFPKREEKGNVHRAVSCLPYFSPAEAGRFQAEILYVHEPSRAFFDCGPWKKLKRILRCRGESAVSSQSACSVNADWIRPGVTCPRLPPIYTLFAVSSCPALSSYPRSTFVLPPCRQRPRLHRDFSRLTLPAAQDVRYESIEPRKSRNAPEPIHPPLPSGSSPLVRDAKGWSRTVLSNDTPQHQSLGDDIEVLRGSSTRTLGSSMLFCMCHRVGSRFGRSLWRLQSIASCVARDYAISPMFSSTSSLFRIKYINFRVSYVCLTTLILKFRRRRIFSLFRVIRMFETPV